MQLDNPDAVFCGTLDIPSDLIIGLPFHPFLGIAMKLFPTIDPS
jgi:hypothetical protein